METTHAHETQIVEQDQAHISALLNATSRLVDVLNATYDAIHNLTILAEAARAPDIFTTEYIWVRSSKKTFFRLRENI